MRNIFLLLLLSLSVPSAWADGWLRIEAGDFQAVAADLEVYSREDFRNIGESLGLADLGPPITIRLEPESGTVKSWVAGYALPPQSLVVLLPQRVPSWPMEGLDELLRHEVAHVLIYRASGGRELPRWLHEGLAVQLSRRAWSWRDSGRVSIALLGGPTSLDEVDEAFSGGPATAREGYAMAAGWVRFLEDRYGAGTSSILLEELASGKAVREAFSRTTGETLRRAERRYFQVRRRREWFTVLTGTGFLWGAMALLTVVAWRASKRRGADIRERWDAEERAVEAVLARQSFELLDGGMETPLESAEDEEPVN